MRQRSRVARVFFTKMTAQNFPHQEVCRRKTQNSLDHLLKEGIFFGFIVIPGARPQEIIVYQKKIGFNRLRRLKLPLFIRDPPGTEYAGILIESPLDDFFCDNWPKGKINACRIWFFRAPPEKKVSTADQLAS